MTAGLEALYDWGSKDQLLAKVNGSVVKVTSTEILEGGPSETDSAPLNTTQACLPEKSASARAARVRYKPLVFGHHFFC